MELYEGQLITENNPVIGRLLPMQNLTMSNGKTYFKGTFQDKDTSVSLVVWDVDKTFTPEEQAHVLDEPIIIRVTDGSVKSYRDQLSITMRAFELLDQTQAEELGLIPVAYTKLEELRVKGKRLLDKVKEVEKATGLKYGSDLIEELLTPDTEYSTRSAAMHMHHAYKYGLLEHSIQVAYTAIAIAKYSKFRNDIDRGVLIAGALLHDVGK